MDDENLRGLLETKQWERIEKSDRKKIDRNVGIWEKEKKRKKKEMT